MPVPILTGAAMQLADQETITELGIPAFALMETAGRSVTRKIIEFSGPAIGKHIAILCGKGNNGGDGLVVARQLALQGASVHVIHLGDYASAPDAQTNLALLVRLAKENPRLRIKVERFEDHSTLDCIGAVDTIVDALLGTGALTEVREPFGSIIAWINSTDAATISIDIPSGLSANTGMILGAAVAADLTVTMGALKIGHLLNDGPTTSGRVDVVEIGIPNYVLSKAATMDGCALGVEDQDVKDWFKPRQPDAHKYSAGTVVAAVGSKRFPGAAVMAASAASRIGAGYVMCAAPQSIQETLAQRLTDITVLPLADSLDGDILAGSRSGIETQLAKANALLVGCGVGREEETLAFVRDMVQCAEVPGVLDADGLYAVRSDKTVLTKKNRKPWILTPHWGEFTALIGSENVDADDRVGLAVRYAREWQCVLILKGMPSVVGCPDGRCFVSRTGNTGLATAGTGDVLAGFCAGLLAQGMDSVEAAVSGLHIGGAIADVFAVRGDPRTMVATDLLDLAPEVVKARFS